MQSTQYTLDSGWVLFLLLISYVEPVRFEQRTDMVKKIQVDYPDGSRFRYC